MLRLILLLTYCCSVTAFAQTSQGPMDSAVAELLKKMSEKPQQINYEGIFTYQHKDNPSLQTFRILHWQDQGVIYDRLQHLNGPEREIYRKVQSDCESVGDRLRKGSVPLLGELVNQMKDYHFELRNKERIAGRIATVLLAVPQDEFRYSYFFSIDDETGLILKVWLVDEKAHPLERYQFIDVNLQPDTSAFLAASPAKGIHKTIPAGTNCVDSQDLANWQFNWLPNGFTFSGQGKPRDNLEMLMFTDGLATFSVFVEPSSSVIPEGVAQRGATLAMMTGLSVNGRVYRVTIVGEIPAITAQRVAQNMAAK